MVDLRGDGGWGFERRGGGGLRNYLLMERPLPEMEGQLLDKEYVTNSFLLSFLSNFELVLSVEKPFFWWRGGRGGGGGGWALYSGLLC